MLSVIRKLVLFLLLLLIVSFAVANRTEVTIVLFPSDYVIGIPLYLLSFIAIFIGILLQFMWNLKPVKSLRKL